MSGRATLNTPVNSNRSRFFSKQKKNFQNNGIPVFKDEPLFTGEKAFQSFEGFSKKMRFNLTGTAKDQRPFFAWESNKNPVTMIGSHEGEGSRKKESKKGFRSFLLSGSPACSGQSLMCDGRSMLRLDSNVNSRMSIKDSKPRKICDKKLANCNALSDFKFQFSEASTSVKSNENSTKDIGFGEVTVCGSEKDKPQKRVRFNLLKNQTRVLENNPKEIGSLKLPNILE